MARSQPFPKPKIYPINPTAMPHIFLDREAIARASLAEIVADINAGERLLADLRKHTYPSSYEAEQEHLQNLSASEDHLQLLYDAELQLLSIM